jgi:hypothetical protein
LQFPWKYYRTAVGKFSLVGEAKDGKITFNKVLKLAEIHSQVIFDEVVIFGFNPGTAIYWIIQPVEYQPGIVLSIRMLLP